jgi:hypothetical protein
MSCHKPGKSDMNVACEKIEDFGMHISFLDSSLFLIIDQPPVYVAAKVKKWFKKNEKRIQVFYLPSYSPDLNPDEKLNQDVKSNAVGRRRPHDQNQMMRQACSYLFSRQRKPHVVKKYFGADSVRYAAV